MPNNAQLLNQYAWAIHRDKIDEKYELGAKLAQKAVELEPDAAYIWDTLAWLLWDTGNKKDAIAAMQKATKLEPDASSYKKSLETMRAAGQEPERAR